MIILMEYMETAVMKYSMDQVGSADTMIQVIRCIGKGQSLGRERAVVQGTCTCTLCIVELLVLKRCKHTPHILKTVTAH